LADGGGGFALAVAGENVNEAFGHSNVSDLSNNSNHSNGDPYL
jgi:hypothetical protein